MRRFWILFSLVLFQSATALREYLVRKDLLTGFKAPEFSIFDASGKTILYRIESNFRGLHAVELISYPSKVVVGKLRNSATFFLYAGSFEIMDSASNQWISGKIEQHLRPFNHKSIIEWNGKKIMMENNFASLTTRFTDTTEDGKLMAEYRYSLSSIFWAKKYTLKVYSDDVPDALYLFGLSVRDYINSRAKSSKG